MDFSATGVTSQNLWFIKSGNNLVVDVMGTSSQITLQGWYGSNGDQVTGFHIANGEMVDSKLQNLVQAMATYSAAHASFNPTTSSAAPSDAALQAAIAADWHH